MYAGTLISHARAYTYINMGLSFLIDISLSWLRQLVLILTNSFASQNSCCSKLSVMVHVSFFLPVGYRVPSRESVILFNKDIVTKFYISYTHVGVRLHAHACVIGKIARACVRRLRSREACLQEALKASCIPLLAKGLFGDD